MAQHSDDASSGPLWAPVPGPLPDGLVADMRVIKRRGRWVVTSVYVHREDDDGVTPSTLQKIRFGDLSQEANLMSWALSHRGSVPQWGGLPAMTEAKGEPSLADLRDLSARASTVKDRQNGKAVPARQALARPDGSDPDGFYQQVAEAYRHYARGSRAPGVEIAEEAGVPLGTARSWIREARRRGFLPPGRRGAAG